MDMSGMPGVSEEESCRGTVLSSAPMTLEGVGISGSC